MQTFSGKGAIKYLEPIFHAKLSAWICSPWINLYVARALGDMASKGIEVKIITSNDSKNSMTNNFLKQLSIDKLQVELIRADSEPGRIGDIIHSKIYIVDKCYAVTGSANLTKRGLHYNNESLYIFDTPHEVHQIENQFSSIWDQFKGNSLLRKSAQNIKKSTLEGSINYR